jgi:hypothetical protein
MAEYFERQISTLRHCLELNCYSVVFLRAEMKRVQRNFNEFFRYDTFLMHRYILRAEA